MWSHAHVNLWNTFRHIPTLSHTVFVFCINDLAVLTTLWCSKSNKRRNFAAEIFSRNRWKQVAKNIKSSHNFQQYYILTPDCIRWGCSDWTLWSQNISIYQAEILPAWISSVNSEKRLSNFTSCLTSFEEKDHKNPYSLLKFLILNQLFEM